MASTVQHPSGSTRAPTLAKPAPLGIRRVLHENGLSIAVALLFSVFLVGQSVAGHRYFNEEQRREGHSTLSYADYLRSGSFVSATMENWESEFLQMAAYVVFTAFLFQKGSSESKKLDEPEAVDRDPRLSRDKPGAPYPVRRGGFLLTLYQHSLSLAFVGLFALCFGLHAWGSTEERNAEARAEGRPVISVAEHIQGAQFWYESLQNWQSEFLALGAMAVFSIFLRQRGSPESKPVDAPHWSTGQE